jgi:NitT/TauT family transport system permease protein
MRKYIIIGPIAFIAIWFVVTRLNIFDPLLLPDPFLTIKEALIRLGDVTFLQDILSTLVRFTISISIAVILGLPTGLLLGMTERIYRSVEFLIDFFRSIPATALFPLFLLIFGITNKSKILVSAFAAGLIIIFNTAYGIMNANKSRLLVTQIMGATKMQIFRSVSFWESLPQTFIGLRSAISLTLVIVIVTEMFIGTTSGLGRRIIDFQIVYEIPSMYATIIISGIIGYVLNLIFLVIEKKFVHWIGRGL